VFLVVYTTLPSQFDTLELPFYNTPTDTPQGYPSPTRRG
jgi:hypothetical protein